jgi:hypothetical protein
MRYRFVASIGVAIGFATLVPQLQPRVVAQTRPAAKPWSPPRTADGHPDLQGNWSFATITPFERPPAFGDKAVLSDREVAEYEKEQAARANQDDNRQIGTLADVSRAYNDAWYDRGTHMASSKQTSIVVDPPNGRIPTLTTEGQARAQARQQERRNRGQADGPEDRSLGERCIIGFNAGPPFQPSAYNNNLQIVQTKDFVTLMTEMVHDARVVPLDGRQHVPSSIRFWLGDSRGHWEGDTLVVETTNFSDKNLYRGATRNMKLTEKFTRTAERTLTYEFTINDPVTWTQPWTGRIPLDKQDGNLYEYACHEGNYGMMGILKGARAAERGAAEAKK